VVALVVVVVSNSNRRGVKMRPGDQTKFVKVPVARMLRIIAQRWPPSEAKNAVMDLAEAWSTGVVEKPRCDFTTVEQNGQNVVMELFDPTPKKAKITVPPPPDFESQKVVDDLIDSLSVGKKQNKGRALTLKEKNDVRKLINVLATENARSYGTERAWGFLRDAISVFLRSGNAQKGYSVRFLQWKIGEALQKVR
jgi:hypothetical protein